MAYRFSDMVLVPTANTFDRDTISILPFRALHRVLLFLAADGARCHLLSMLRTCSAMEALCLPLVYRHTVVRATGAADPFANTVEYFTGPLSKKLAGLVEILQFHCTVVINGIPHRRTLFLHTAARVAQCTPRATKVLLSCGDLDEDEALTLSFGPAPQVSFLLFNDMTSVRDRPGGLGICVAFPNVVATDFAPPQCVDTVADAIAALEFPSQLAQREAIRTAFHEHTALFLSVLSGAHHLRKVSFKLTSHIAFFSRDKEAPLFEPELCGAQLIHTTTFVIAVAELAITSEFQSVQALLLRMIDSLPFRTTKVRVAFDFGCKWPMSSHLAALQLRDIDIAVIVRALRRRGKRVHFVILNLLGRTGRRTPTREQLAALLPSWTASSLQDLEVTFDDNETPIDLFENFLCLQDLSFPDRLQCGDVGQWLLSQQGNKGAVSGGEDDDDRE